jgi:hypothetical protein
MPTAQANEPPAKIIALEYPRVVRPASQVIVTVDVAYSSKFGMIDVGIWDAETATVIQSLVSNVTLSGPGQASFSFSLQSPNTSGRWNLEAITRAWVQDAWFTDQAGIYAFSVSVFNNATLTLDRLQPDMSFLIDGKSYSSNGPSIVESLTFGVHSVEIPSIIPDGPDSRLVFIGWSDGLGSNPRTIVMAENLSLSPIYMKQYRLTVTSNIGTATGSGWYGADQNAEFAVVPEITQSTFYGLLTDSYSFASWSGASNSSSPISTVLMDGPKMVSATWVQTRFSLNLVSVADLLLLASCFLAVRVGSTEFRTKYSRRRINNAARALQFLIMILLTMTLLMPPTTAQVQVPTPVNATIITIGDASWYYWNQTASDTCIFWLGGGTIYSQGGYLINPLDYESFGTIRFLQDLTKYYCLIALEKGPYLSTDTANRTIHQELLQGQYSIIRQIHEWIKAQGYKHIFLIGYSVGAIAAAIISVSFPETWTNSDGLILITAFLTPNAIYGAEALRANLMLIYGHAPMYEETGLQFFDKAPSEGWHGSTYYHKEFHVLDDMGHEVWSPLKTNRYSTLALGITVNFIEQSNTLQFNATPGTYSGQEGNWTVNISKIESPSKMYSDNPLILNVILTSMNLSSTETVIVAYTSESNQPVSSTQLSSTNQSNVHLIIPPTNASALSLLVVVLQKRDEQWQVSSRPYPVRIEASNQVTLRIISRVPNNQILIDGVVFTASSSGQLQATLSLGFHTLEVKSVIYQNNETRYLFRQWDDSDASTTKTIELYNDTIMEAVYQEQYYVIVTSPFGITDGSGWHDGASSFMPNLNSLVLSQSSVIFIHWISGNSEFDLGSPIHVTSPTTVRAIWQTELTKAADAGTAWFTVSLIMFSVLLALNLIMRNRSRRN